MAILKLRKDKEDEKDKGPQTVVPAAQAPSQGQTGLTDEVLNAIIQAVTVATKGITPAAVDAPATEAELGVASTFGDRNTEKLKETLGDETAEALLSAFDSVSGRSSQDAAILLDAINGQQEQYTDAMKKLEEQITGMAKIDPEREWIARGYNLFNENPDATLEYLEAVGEAAGPLLGDAVEKFEQAQIDQDYGFLDKVRVGLKDSLAQSQKDHAGVAQSGAVSLTKSEARKLKESNEAYDAERDKALSKTDPKERLAAILEMGTEAAA